jgi:hypothetical protein
VKGASTTSLDVDNCSCFTAQSSRSAAMAEVCFARSPGTSSLAAAKFEANKAKSTPRTVAEPRSTAACHTSSGCADTPAETIPSRNPPPAYFHAPAHCLILPRPMLAQIAARSTSKPVPVSTATNWLLFRCSSRKIQCRRHLNPLFGNAYSNLFVPSEEGFLFADKEMRKIIMFGQCIH